MEGWRAYIDIQSIYDSIACLEYIAEYSTKAEKMSYFVQDAFTSIVQNLHGTEDIQKVIQKLAIKSTGECDLMLERLCIILCY